MRRRSSIAVSALLLPLALVAGCHGAPPRAVPPVVSAPDQEFWDRLPQAACVAEDDAFRALLAFARVTNDDTAEARVAALQDRGWLPKDYAARADRPATAGVAARILCGALAIRGGVTLRTFGMSERYATRELVDQGVLPPDTTPTQILSGMTLTRILGQADRLREHTPATSR